MRTGELRKDGTVSVSLAVKNHLTDLNRYLRFRAGETFADLAIADDITPEAAKLSVSTGRRMYEAEQLIELRDLKHQSAIATERIRKKARERTETLILDGLETLLSGKRTIASIRKSDGEIITQEITDPELISLGLEHARKIISIDERPAQNQTYVNIQNNQQNISESGQGAAAMSYEERLKRIRNAQTGIPSANEQIIEAEIIKSDVVEQPPETEATPETPNDWETF